MAMAINRDKLVAGTTDMERPPIDEDWISRRRSEITR